MRLTNGLKDTYAPFDPELATVAAQPLAEGARQTVLDELFRDFDVLMRRANFLPLSHADIERASLLRSDWGINMQVAFELFEKLQVYYRGNTVGQRRRRSWRRFWKEEIVEVPVFQRFAVIIKLKKSNRFPISIDTDDVFLKYFKDIPQADIEMLLPGARIVMPGIHRLKVGGSMVSGLALIAFNIAKQLLTAAVLPVAYFYGLIFAVLGYGWRQYAGYQSARHACSLRLTESLYFQSLANNQGVLHCLLDEAEEQDGREAILAYYYLWRDAGAAGITMNELDAAIERDLEAKLGRPIDFEVDDALEKLQRMKLAALHGDRFVAVPIDDALEQLDREWDNLFAYHRAAEAA